MHMFVQKRETSLREYVTYVVQGSTARSAARTIKIEKRERERGGRKTVTRTMTYIPKCGLGRAMDIRKTTGQYWVKNTCSRKH